MNSISTTVEAAQDASPFTVEWHRRLQQKLTERLVPESEWPRYFKAMANLSIPGFDAERNPDGATLKS